MMAWRCLSAGSGTNGHVTVAQRNATAALQRANAGRQSGDAAVIAAREGLELRNVDFSYPLRPTVRGTCWSAKQ
jgi:hypothetical protein